MFVKSQDEKTAHELCWDDVKLFLALCRSRSLGAAAKRLRVDGSTVSRRLSALEQGLSTTLFERSRGGVTMTESAEALMPVAEEIEHSMERFVGHVESLEQDVSGLVRVACPTDVAEVLLVPLLPQLMQAHPRLRLEIIAGESLNEIGRSGVDIGLRTALPERADLIATKLIALRLIVAAAPELAAKVGTLHSWSDVPWIGWGQRFSELAPARWLDERTCEEDVVLRSSSLGVQFSAVSRGLGAALLPEPSLRHYGLTALNLAPTLQKNAKLPSERLHIVTHRSLRNVPRVRAVWEFLLANAAKFVDA